MSSNSLVTMWTSVVLLSSRIWRSMPVLASAWLGVPLLLGALIVPAFAAQRDLIDLFGSTAGEQAWADVFKLAWPPLVIIIGIALLRSVLASLQDMLNIRLQDRASMHIQSEVHKRAISVPLERMDHADYYDRLQRAELVAGTDLLGLLQNLISCVRYLFEIAALMLVVSLVHPVLGIVLGVVFTISLTIRLESEIVVRRLNRDLTQSGRQSDYLSEAITQASTVKEMRIFDSMNYLIQKWLGIMRHSLSLRMNARRREIRYGMIVSSVQIIGLFGAIVWMVFQMKSIAITAGTVVIVFQAMRQAFSISSSMQHPISKIYIQSAKVFDLVEFLRESPENCLSNQTLTIESSTNRSPGSIGKIVFEDVTYRYANTTIPILESINLTLNPGETVALVGENGAGKSTLVRLILGLYHPTEGRITWDDIALNKLDPTQLRHSMSAAFQDFVRYETTLRDNVGFGLSKEIHNDTAIRQALRVSGASELEVNSGGLDTPVGLMSDGGQELSGGQWQRLAIARAAVLDAQLLVLDEPTAALDPEHETEMYRSFRELSQGKTVLFVSHRLGWARFADRIVVLKDGCIVEEGTHDTLMALGREYSSMFHAQAEWYKSDPILT
jgi:ATP-binding cassette subfamily B protein